MIGIFSRKNKRINQLEKSLGRSLEISKELSEKKGEYCDKYIDASRSNIQLSSEVNRLTTEINQIKKKYEDLERSSKINIDSLKVELDKKSNLLEDVCEEARASDFFIKNIFWEKDNYSIENKELKKQIKVLKRYQYQYQADQENRTRLSEQKQDNPLLIEILRLRDHYPTTEELIKEHKYLKYSLEEIEKPMSYIDFILYEIDDDAVIEKRRDMLEIEYGYTEQQFKEFEYYCKQRIEKIELILEGSDNA
ncbi:MULTISPECIES: hypothetical protein [Cysteiniphilum]|uniref:hypothetical protein n=1 Tax=Cysteiniphilum TaxID=2056696 RepID=UPI001781A1B0|nr:MULTISPECIES: hypothetical protein [Cysteiniphilum]